MFKTGDLVSDIWIQEAAILLEYCPSPFGQPPGPLDRNQGWTVFNTIKKRVEWWQFHKESKTESFVRVQSYNSLGFTLKTSSSQQPECSEVD